VNPKSKLTGTLRRAITGAVLTILVGLTLSTFRIGEGLVHLSYDLPFAFGSEAVPDDIIIVKMDEASNVEFNQTSGLWDRRIHAQLLDKLRTDENRLAVFDVFFGDPGNPEENEKLARAIKAHGNVVVAAELEPMSQPAIAQPRILGNSISLPMKEFRAAAKAWGIVDVPQDTDLTVREHHPGTDRFPSLPWVAAVIAGAPIINSTEERMRERWIHYYGRDGTITTLSYDTALAKPNGYFRGKIVFIGGKPRIVRQGESNDLFRTPHTRRTGELTQGVEIMATLFLNLMRGDWLTRLSPVTEFLVLTLAGLLFGFGLSLVRPWPAVGLALFGGLALAVLAVLLVWQKHIWFSWMVVSGAQIPCALGWAILSYTTSLYREKQVLEIKAATAQAALEASESATILAQAQASRPDVSIPDHTLVRSVGRGAYGEVWLAKSAIGSFHAVKIVHRHDFRTPDSYEREFKGIERYMPISLEHPGLVCILHVGRNDEDGYYYYVMETADDEMSAQRIDPDHYIPRTLGRDLQKCQRVPVRECVSIGLALTSALDFLHRHHLIHRDIKPSNIIFVNGAPKLADIGLVTEIAERGKGVTYVGTEGYIAPEGPGTAAADLYSLGKVMYEASMGCDAQQFPELPVSLTERIDAPELLRLNAIVLKVCENDVSRRYKSATALHADLLELQDRFGWSRAK